MGDSPPTSIYEQVPGLTELFAVCYRTQWASMGLLPPDELVSLKYQAKPPMPLDEACERMIGLLDNKPEGMQLPKDFREIKPQSLYALNITRLAIAELARGEVLTGATPAVSNWLDKMALRLADDPDLRVLQQAYAEELEREKYDEESAIVFDAQKLLSLLRESEPNPDARFFAAFSHGDLRLLNGRNSPPPRLRNYSVARSYRNRVVETSASVEVRRPSTDFPDLVDPRRWSRNLNSLWSRSEVLQSTPADRGVEIKESTVRNFADLNQAVFFEEAMFGFGVVPITRYRNLLSVNVDRAGQQVSDRCRFTYAQHSCLTAEFFGLGERLAGGIDVDSGGAECCPVPNDARWTRLSARKASRFDLPADPLINRIYNDIAAVALTLLIEVFVLFGAFAKPQP